MFDNIKLRTGTYDREILKEVPGAYGWMDVKDKVVLDIGGCFGAATVMFLEKGAKHVTVVEPEQDNVKQIYKNVGRFRDRVTVREGAVTAEGGRATLYLNAGINTGGHSLHVQRGRDSVSVPAMPFRAILAAVRPSVLKIDCEGAEYDFLTQPLPSYVKQVAMEIHLNKKAWRARAPALIALFDGWRVVRQPSLGEKNWHTMGGWAR